MSECLIHIDLFCALAEEVDSDKKPSGPRFGLTCPECRQPVQADRQQERGVNDGLPALHE